MTRLSISILFFICVFPSFSFYAQSIASIEIRGNNYFSANDYLSWARINNDSKIFCGLEDSIKNRILTALQREGFYNSTIEINLIPIDSTKSEAYSKKMSKKTPTEDSHQPLTENSKLVLIVHEDQPTLISNIKFDLSTRVDRSTLIEYDKQDSIFISKILLQLSNKIFNQSLVEEAFNEILTFFENNGFPFASIKIESIYFYNDSTQVDKSNEFKSYANLFLKIDKGIKSKIDRIEISGNTKTKDFVIARAIGLNIGDYYNQNKIDAIPIRLNRLSFFEQVDTPKYYINSRNEGVLKITVKEKNTNNFDGLIGYIPKGTDGKGYATGFINIGLRNLFGTGRAVLIRWQQENKNSQELELKYLEPWIFNFPLNITGSLFQRIQDSTYVQRTLEGNIEFIASEDISASLILSSQSTIPIERKNKIFSVYNSTSITTGINIKIDTRDDYYSPRKGIFLINTYKYTSKKIEGPKEFLTNQTHTFLQRLELDFGFFKEIFNDQIVAFEIHARQLRGSDIELSDLYLLGGTKTLRGYFEKQFQGNRILWSNLEYRFLLTRRSFAFLFFDSGTFHQSSTKSVELRTEILERNISKLNGFKIGYGFGLNLETSLGIFSVSFALAKGDSFSDGKIHFGIISEF